MSHTDTYYKYRYDRVLIDASRLYTPQLAAAWVYLSGAQVEMLRNMTQYLNRPNTYVEEYAFDNYLTPDDEQFDNIQSIVADLEEKLMGSPNTPWGFNEEYHVCYDNESDVNGTFTVNLPKPSADTIHRVMGMSVYRSVNPATTARLQVNYPGGPRSLEEVAITICGLSYPNTRTFIVTDTDNIRVLYRDATIGEFFHTCAWGYKMVVPE